MTFNAGSCDNSVAYTTEKPHRITSAALVIPCVATSTYIITKCMTESFGSGGTTATIVGLFSCATIGAASAIPYIGTTK